MSTKDLCGFIKPTVDRCYVLLRQNAAIVLHIVKNVLEFTERMYKKKHSFSFKSRCGANSFFCSSRAHFN